MTEVIHTLWQNLGFFDWRLALRDHATLYFCLAYGIGLLLMLPSSAVARYHWPETIGVSALMNGAGCLSDVLSLPIAMAALVASRGLTIAVPEGPRLVSQWVILCLPSSVGAVRLVADYAALRLILHRQVGWRQALLLYFANVLSVFFGLIGVYLLSAESRILGI